MKKLILPITLFVFLLLVSPSNTYAQSSSNCWKEFSNVKPVCDQAVLKHNSCTDPDLSSPCQQDSKILLDKCDQANNILRGCLGLDKEPWTLQSKQPGHLTCGEWKSLMIAGTAQNCVLPTWTTENELRCLSSIAEMRQVRAHPVDYVLDFDPNSCITTEDDLRQFKAGLPLTSGSSPEVSRDKTNSRTGQTPSPFNIFGINPYQTWLNLKELAKTRAFMGTGALDRFTESTILHGVGVEPYWERDARQEKEFKDVLSNPKLWERAKSLTEEDETEAWNFLPNQILPSEENITVVKGQGQIKPRDSVQFVTVSNSSVDMPPFTTYVDSIFTGTTSEMVTVRFAWGTQSGAMINIPPKTEVRILKPMKDKETQDLIRAIKLSKGELEVKVKNANPKNKFEVQTDFVDLTVIGTHFWIKNDPDRKITMIGVYEGKVEVKTKDGQKTTIVPNGDKPGVVVIAQKLSTVKLAIAGLVLATMIGGIVLFLKKRGMKTLISKKKTSR